MREITAGAALGAFIGLMVGLAASEVVGSVVAGLVALLAAFFGLQGGTTRLPAATPQRIAAFSVAAILAVLAGVGIRATDAFAPDPQSRASEWQAAGFDARTAGRIVAFERLGVVPGIWFAPEGAIDAAQERTTNLKSALFADVVADSCATLNGRTYPTADALVEALKKESPVWSDFADAVPSDLPEASRANVLRAGVALVCKGL
jgi:hypothetical protein